MWLHVELSSSIEDRNHVNASSKDGSLFTFEIMVLYLKVALESWHYCINIESPKHVIRRGG